MTLLYLDTETFSECDLKSHGTHRYAEHPSTEITVAQWAVDDGEPVVHDCTGRFMPTKLQDLLNDPTVLIVAHNSAFDRALIRHCWGIDIPPERWYDTMIQAMSHGLPGALDKIGAILKLNADEAKDKRGRELIQLFCKPRPKTSTLRRATRETHPAEWQEFLEYSRQDIVAMRAIGTRLPKWNYSPGSPEHKLWHLDQRINDRGFLVDLDLANAAVDAVAVEQKRLKAEITDQTDGQVQNASKRDQLLKYILAEYEVELPDMKADTLRRRLEDPELPEAVKLLISIRLEATKTSTAKYGALLKATSGDGRLRNTLQFAGAVRTARWAGRIFQPQNLPRPTPGFDGEAQDDVVECLKHNALDLFYTDVMQQTSNCIRGCIIAPPGKKLVVADLSNIEGRGLAYLAGEAWKLRAFADYDAGKGPDLYVAAFARAMDADEATVTKHQRQQGKVMELGCLAADTPVVTNNGVKRIVDVLANDKLWDGVEWVTHQGLVEKGVKLVVPVAGIELTPDHLVLTEATWTQAQELASSESMLSRALATSSENSPSWLVCVSDEVRATWTWSRSNARAAHPRTSSSTTTYEKARAPAATPAQKRSRTTGEKHTRAMPTWSWMTRIAHACSTAFQRASRDATTRTMRAIRTTAAEAFSFLNPGALTAVLSWPTSSPSKGGISPVWSLTERMSTRGTNLATCVSSQSAKTKVTDVPCENFSNASLNSKPTFDILNAGPRNRFTVLTERGPLIVHNCGYEGGVAAFLTFAAVYNMDLDALADAVYKTAPVEALQDAQGMWGWARKKNRTLGLPERVYVACEVLKRAWRNAHPQTVALWAAAGDSVREAIRNPGQTFPIGEHLRARVDGAWLRIRLPSGRYLCYLEAKVADDGQVSYAGVNQYTRQWGRIKTYGGKLVENATQAFARDVMAHNMAPIDQVGYEIVLSVHDELITEAPEMEEYSVDHLARMLAAVPPWAAGIPLAAAGFEATRYKKE